MNEARTRRREFGELREIERAEARELARYVDRKEPVVLTGLSVDLAAWTPAAISARCGAARVRTCTHEAATERDPMGYVDEVTIAEYFERQFEARASRRIMGHPLAALEGKDDLARQIGLTAHVPPWLAPSRSLFYASAAGGVVPLHYDIDFAHIFMIQAYGGRSILLFGPDQSRNLYKIPFRPEPLAPLDEMDPARFPRVRSLRARHCRLEAGEVLYMPAGWFHFVEYLEPSCGISLRFRKAGLEGELLARYGKTMAIYEQKIRDSALGWAWIYLMKGAARL